MASVAAGPGDRRWPHYDENACRRRVRTRILDTQFPFVCNECFARPPPPAGGGGTGASAGELQQGSPGRAKKSQEDGIQECDCCGCLYEISGDQHTTSILENIK